MRFGFRGGLAAYGAGAGPGGQEGLEFAEDRVEGQAGAEPQQEVTDIGGGGLIASVKDADGNPIGLIQS